MKNHNNKLKNGIEYGYNTKYRRFMPVCVDCKKILSRIGTRRCQKHAYLAELNQSFVDGHTTKKYYCIDCKKQLKGVCSFLHKRCKSCNLKWQVGVNHPTYGIRRFGNKNPNYKHGLSKLPYPIKFNNQLKNQIKKRDDYKCRLCVLIEKAHLKLFGIKLHIHHINYNKINCEENNLITLCRRCHLSTYSNRDYWYAYFKYIMENK